MFYNAFHEVIHCNIVNQENLKQSGCALYIAKKKQKKPQPLYSSLRRDLWLRAHNEYSRSEILRQIPRQ